MIFRLRHQFPLLVCLALIACKPSAPTPVSSAAPAPAKSEASAEPASAPKAADQDAPKPDFPKLVVKTFDGGEFDLASQRGHWVVVNFWATWCNPCLKEIPDLAALDKARDDFVVIGLAYEEIEKADMEAFLKAHPISYPIAVVDVYSPPADFGIPRGLPMTYLIDPQGRVASEHLGPVTADQLQKEIDGAKAKPRA
jgi:thiol-disulfide isomerase/thioredoxin